MDSDYPILLIDDDIVDIETVRRAFNRNKLANPLFAVTSGEEGLQYLRGQGPYASEKEAPRPALVLLDLNMPGMGGLEVLAEVKRDETLRTIPVVVLTTSREDPDRRASYQAGAAGYIVKPVDFHKFVDAIATLNAYWKLCEHA